MNAERQATIVRWAIRSAPWIVSAVIVAILARTYDPSAVVAQMRLGAWHAAAPYAFVFPSIFLLAHAYWDTTFLRGTLDSPGVEVPAYRHIFGARAACALLGLVNYLAGQGGFGVWLARRSNAHAKAVAGALLFTLWSDFVALCIVFTLATSSSAGEGVDHALRTTVQAGAASSVAFALAGPYLFARTGAAVLAPWRDARRSLLQLAGRSVDFFIMLLVTWHGARAFGLTIPFGVFMAYMPLVVFLGGLPLNVGPFGTGQVGFLVFLPWATGEKLLAFNIIWQCFASLGIFARGAPFLRRVARDLPKRAAGEPD